LNPVHDRIMILSHPTPPDQLAWSIAEGANLLVAIQPNDHHYPNGVSLAQESIFGVGCPCWMFFRRLGNDCACTAPVGSSLIPLNCCPSASRRT
jgi:hypothetical protein